MVEFVQFQTRPHAGPLQLPALATGAVNALKPVNVTARERMKPAARRDQRHVLLSRL